MFKKIFLYLVNLLKYIANEELLKLPELNNKMGELENDYSFFFRNKEDEDAYMHLREMIPFEFESHNFNPASNQGVFLLKYKRKFFILRYHKSDNVIEIVTFAAIGKKELVCPLDLDNIDDIYLVNGYARAQIVSCLNLQDGVFMGIEISFKRISIFASYTEVTETVYRFISEVNSAGVPILKEKKKPEKYFHDASVVTTKEC